MTPRRSPRTMQQAFGPYTSHELDPMPQRSSRAERVADVLLAVILGLAGAVFAVHFLSR